MKRTTSAGLILGTMFVAAAVVACNPGDELVPIEPGGGAKAATNTYTLHEGVVQADATVARDAVVLPDSITLPFAGHESLLDTVKPGSVFFGDRAPGMPDSNPLGFNAHVDSLERVGDRIVLHTHPANIDELFDQADFGSELLPLNDGQDLTMQGFDGQVNPLDVSQGSGSFTIPINFNFGRLFQGEQSGGNTTAKGEISLAGGIALSLNTQAGFRYEGRGWGRVPDLALSFNCGAELEFDACAKVKGEIIAGKAEHDGLIAFDGKPHNISKTLRLGQLSIPLSVPPPLVVTGRYTAEIVCGVNYSKEVGGAYQYKNKYQLTSRFGTQGGNGFGGGSFTTEGGQQRWEFVMKGGLTLQCGVSVKVGFYFYDSAGLYVRVAPGATLGVSGAFKLSGGTGQSTPTAQVQGCANFEAKIDTFWGAEATLGWLGDYGKEYPLATPARLDLPFPLSKCVQNFQPGDSCSGKQDGLYCSNIDTRGSYRCRGGSTAGGNACQSGQYCQTKEGKAGGEAQEEGDAAKCGTNAPEPEQLELTFCPSAPQAERASSGSH